MKKKIFTSAKLLLMGVILLCYLVFSACSALTLEFAERDLTLTNLDGKTLPIRVELARSTRDMTPFSHQSVDSSEPVRYALEVPQGWFKKNNIGKGCTIKLP